jgi:exodeoxyribonuclease (lambda-induced)
MIIFDTSPQGSDDWLRARMGACTGSRCKDARDRSDGMTTQQRTYVNARTKLGMTEAAAMTLAGYKKAPTSETVAAALAGKITMEWSASAMAYAMDLAREREGGKVPPTFVNQAMRTGTEQEPVAREQFEVVDGYLVQQAGFAYTEDRRFGCSVDGLLGDDGIWECKTMVSSQTLFKAMVYGDISEYRDQCLFEMWLLRRQFVLLSLWCPDLQKLHTIRIDRDEAEMQALEDDLLAFDALVLQYRNDLRKVLGRDPLPAAVDQQAPVAPPWDDATPVTVAPAVAANDAKPAPVNLPENIFG